ncbi:hypothetical protein G7K_4097-t1 [Saitoella complicata NRRL Y-17804]|uniref:Uncharacterized protein n=1 Tax=Saitoella complicata (strain BCRC 22490 / CBS 7301 / JCM 7358 / NBRC 10748 / NRRL Y-17804) TaxID=698492 RepID=A0A0E9NJB8_SAICN|nr:hypothetical protein G7K_4097-t1 [Saitoella complicata NRRL Y-17804]
MASRSLRSELGKQDRVISMTTHSQVFRSGRAGVAYDVVLPLTGRAKRLLTSQSRSTPAAVVSKIAILNSNASQSKLPCNAPNRFARVLAPISQLQSMTQSLLTDHSFSLARRDNGCQ